jgi:hypothetical protein
MTETRNIESDTRAKNDRTISEGQDTENKQCANVERRRESRDNEKRRVQKVPFLSL